MRQTKKQRKKGNSDVFLVKIDQGIEEILKFKPRNIAIRTDYGELTLNMLTGSKSRHLQRKKAIQMYFC